MIYIILLLFIIVMLPSHKTIENFTINDVDVGTIKNLSLLADSLMKDGKLIIPGGLEISGPLKIGNWKIGVEQDHLRYKYNDVMRYSMHNPTAKQYGFYAEDSITSNTGNIKIKNWNLDASDEVLRYNYNNNQNFAMVAGPDGYLYSANKLNLGNTSLDQDILFDLMNTQIGYIKISGELDWGETKINFKVPFKKTIPTIYFAIYKYSNAGSTNWSSYRPAIDQSKVSLNGFFIMVGLTLIGMESLDFLGLR